MEPTPRSIEQTYSNRVYPVPWEKVEDYQRVQAYAAKNPTPAGRPSETHWSCRPCASACGLTAGNRPDPRDARSERGRVARSRTPVAI